MEKSSFWEKFCDRKLKNSGLEISQVSSKCKQTIWDEIMLESDLNNKNLEEYKRNQYPKPDIPLTPPMEYMETKLLNLLRNAMENMLSKAIDTDSLIRYASTFNGIDYLSEFLWNLNPGHPKRAHKPTYIFDMAWVKSHLHKHPREYFPLSWIYTEEIAAGIIQRSFRAYLVRRRDDVQEMRQFWRILEEEAAEGLPHDKLFGKSVIIDITSDYRTHPNMSRYHVFKTHDHHHHE